MPSAVTVLNPGVAVPSAFADLADVIVTFEGSCDDYLAEGATRASSRWRGSPGPDQTIWHMVHHTPDAARAAEVIALGRARGADLVYVTDGCGENPYSSLPSNEIWTPSSSTSGVGRRPSAPHWWLARHRVSAGHRTRRIVSPELVPDSLLISNPTLSRRLHLVEASADFVVASSSPRVFLASGSSHGSAVVDGKLAADRGRLDDREQPAVRLCGERHRLDLDAVGSGDVRGLRQRVRWRVEADRIGLDHDAGAQAAFHVSAPGLREYSAVAIRCTRPMDTPPADV